MNGKMTFRNLIMVMSIAGMISCTSKPAEKKAMPEDRYDLLADLYYSCDTVIRTQDTVKIVHLKFDTTIVETGIFTYLQYDFPLTTSKKLIGFARSAREAEQKDEQEKAKEHYKAIIDYYHVDRTYDVKGFSDMNGLLQYEVNTAILCSYAYEKLGEPEKAVEVLKPMLANVEARNSKIHQRFLELCIANYGKNNVKEALENCYQTVHFKKKDAPELDSWVVTVFGADLGVDERWKNVTREQADSLLKEMDFYKALQQAGL